MNFYYDPILGLQYDYLGDFFIVDIASIPELDLKETLNLINRMGILIVDTYPKMDIQVIGNITEYKL